MGPKKFNCYLVRRDAQGRVVADVTQRRLDELPPGDVLIRVSHSSLNYKDALAATGHPGVVKSFPHIPGVDAAGRVAASGVYEWIEGDPVLVTGFDLGAGRWGGFAEYVSVPQDWLVRLPDGLTEHESMILGTAGFTAALCIDALRKHDVMPERGDVVVTGASGGVGSMAVAILAKLGYRVSAVTGKLAAHEYLKQLGAAEILHRTDVDDRSQKPMLQGRWAGAVDTVGGNTLGTLLRSTRHGGCVSACGLVGGHELPITVYPFILRGVTLAGIDAAWPPLPLRHDLWQHLAASWKPAHLERIKAAEISLHDLPRFVEDILAGQITGRVVVTPSENEPS